MPDAVYRMMTLLCALVRVLPIGTNLGLLHLLWMVTSGRLLASAGGGVQRVVREWLVRTGDPPGVGGAGAGRPDERAVARTLGGAGCRGRAVAAADPWWPSPGGGRGDGVLAATPARLPDDALPSGGRESVARHL